MRSPQEPRRQQTCDSTYCFETRLDYAAVGQAVSRFGKRLTKDTKLRNEIRRLETQLSNVEM